MEYEYNGHLPFEERINLVSKEIIKEYPFINIETAKLISSIEKPITEKVNEEIKFQRLFNILFFLQNDKEKFEKVFEDILITYKKINKTQKSSEMMEGLIKYIEGKDTFPKF